MVIVIILLVFGLCVSLYNYWFQSERCKRLLKQQTSQINIFNSPKAWLTYFFVFFHYAIGYNIVLYI